MDRDLGPELLDLDVHDSGSDVFRGVLLSELREISDRANEVRGLLEALLWGDTHGRQLRDRGRILTLHRLLEDFFRHLRDADGGLLLPAAHPGLLGGFRL